MRKRITSALLTLVMLLSLIPAMGTTAAAADTETHPEMVNFLDNGEYKLCYYTDKWDDYGSREYKKVSVSEITGSTSDEIWQAFTAKYAKKGVGWIYYIQETGTLYIKGTIPSIVFRSKADAENVLKVIVDGKTTIERAIYGHDGSGGRIAPGLKQMTIDFRNGSILTLRENTSSKKKALLDITKTEGNAVRSYGDLKLTGDGTLKIAPDDYTNNVMFGIRANNISVLDNVSLDIKMGSRGTNMVPVSAAAITCEGKLNINTTGTVNIDVSEKIDPNAKNGFGFFKVFSNITDTTFNLTHAKSVTLKAREKKDTFVAYYDYVTGGENWHATIMNDLSRNGWTVTETEDTAKPSYTVTMTPQALSEATLNVGSQEIQRTGAVTKGEIQADGSKQSLSIRVKEPAWLKTLHNASRVDYNCTAAVYENGTKLSEDFALSWGGGTSTLWLTLRDDFTPTVGKSYIVTFSITPKVKATGEKLESAAINGNWLLTAVKKQKTFLNAVELTQDGKILTDRVNPDVTVAADAPYQITEKGTWVETASGSGVYRRTVTLKVKDAANYGFMGGAKVTVTGGGDVTATNGSVKGAGDTMTTTLTAYRYYQVKFGSDAAARLIRAGTGVDAPAYTGTVEAGKEFKGWQAGEGGAIYAPGTTIFPDKDMTLTAVFEEQPETPEPVYQFSLGVGEENKPRVQFEQEEDYNSTGTNTDLTVTVTDTSTNGAKLTGLTARFSDTKFKRNNKWFELYTGTWDSNFKDESALTHELSSLTFDESGKATFGVHLSRMKKTAEDPYSNKTMPVGHCYAIIELTATYEGGGEVKGNLIVELTVNERTEYGLKFEAQFPEGTSDATKNGTTVLVNGTSGVYNYSGNADRGEVVTIKAVPADGLEFVQWKETNVAPGEGKVQFTDATSAETSFIMPKYNVELTAVYKTSTHTHNYGTWTPLDDEYHYQTCTSTTGTCNEPTKVAEHSFGDWTPDTADATRHYKECSVCHHKVYADHEESARIIDTEPTFEATGTWHTECEVCGEQMSNGTIAQLVKIDVANLTVAKPVKGVAAAEATTTDAAYYVAATEWVAADGTVLDIANGDKFQPGTVYAVKITLETAGDGVFSASSTYNSIDGKTATVSPALTGDGYTDTVVLTYTFDATEDDYVSTAPSITTTALPDGKVGEAYNQLLSANGSAPITWSVESGALPDGLTLNSANGTIGGAPAKAGDFKFTVKATNAGGSDTKELTIKIADTEPAKYHDVTITGAGTGATGAGSHAAGTTVNIYAGTKSGYTFDGWTSDDVTILSASSKNASFVMPDKAVTVKANWTYNGGGSGGGGYTYYTIKATAGVNGSISPSGNVSVREGRDQTFTITPDKGYAVSKVLIDSKNVGAVKSYTFENVKKNHTIEVVFMKAGGNPQTGVFVDVPEDSYYEEAVNWAVENGITTGTDATHFTPDGICTRVQAMTFLWRAAGSPAPKSTTMPFTDVKAGSYYYDAVLWAVENGITKGTSATEFSPAQNCSRAQIVTFLWRSEKSPAAGTVNPFADVKPDAYYADAVLWAVKEDVTKGTTATTFSPNANCTRAQIVTFIWRALAE